MNQKEKALTIENNRKKYRIPSGANYQLRSKNAIYISPSNSVKHELAKALGGYMLRKWGDIKFSARLVKALEEVEKASLEVMIGFVKEKTDFITEAVPKKEPERRIDLVKLDDDTRFEWESNKKIKKENSITIYI